MKQLIKKMLLSFLALFLIFQLSPNIQANAEDDVIGQLQNRAFKQPEIVGVPAKGAIVTDAVLGKEDGKDVAYTTANGGLFNVIDVKNNKVLFSEQLGDINQVWTHSIAPDGTVYVAGLAKGNIGELWSYSPETKSVTKHGVADSTHQFWSSTTDDEGNVYIGTYKEGEGKVFKYDVVKDEFVDLGKIDQEGDSSYVRSIAYHDGYIYAGLGVTGNVYRINVDTFEKEKITKNAPDILGVTMEGLGFAYDMVVVEDYLVVRFSGPGAVLLYDLIEQKWVEDVIIGKTGDGSDDDVGAFGFSQLAVQDNKMYIINNRRLVEVDLNTLELNDMDIRHGAGWRGTAFVDYSDDGSDIRLVTMARTGEVLTIDLNEKKIISLPLAMDGNLPLTLHNLGKGPDGNLYMTTYPGGPKGAQYNPKTGEFTSYSQGQAEGLVAGSGSDMYFGIYPAASIQKMNTDTLEIKTLFNLRETYEQDRPYIMKYENNKLLIGTIPDYQKLGGTLTIYDPETEERETHRNVVQDQSIVGLAYKDGKIYGSTTIFGGLDIQPAAKKAKMFVWDVENQKKIEEFELDLPELDKPPLISGLTFDENGLLWGAVDGILFAMNPDTLEIEKYKNIYPEIKNRGMWRPVHIIFGEDGLLYTDIAGKLTVVDPASDDLDHVSLTNSGPEVNFIELAEDVDGNQHIYFIDGESTYLKMVRIIDKEEGEDPEEPEYETVDVPIINPGFEEPLGENNDIPGWSSLFTVTDNVSYEISNERSKTGENSLKIVDLSQDETVFVQSEPIPIKGGIEYTGSVELYLEDGSASYFLRYYDKDGNQVGKDQDGENIIHVRDGHKKWQTVKAKVMAPDNAEYVRLFAGASKYFTTSGAYYDDFTLTYQQEKGEDEEDPELSEVNLEIEQPSLLQGEESALMMTGTLTDGSELDMTKTTIEWMNSSPEVVEIVDGKIIGKNAGTTDIQAVVIFGDKEVLSNRVTVTVEVTTATLKNQIELLEEAGEIKSSLAKQLTNSLKQAKHHYDKGDVEQAKKHLEDFVKHFDKSDISDELKETLNKNVKAIEEHFD